MPEGNGQFSWKEGLALEKYLLSRIEGLGAHLTVRLDAMEKAVDKALLASDQRFQGVNEFRGQLKDQQATLISRIEAEIQIKGARAEAKADLAGIAIEMRAGLAEVKSDLDDLAKYRATMEGKASQGSVNLAMMFSAMGTILAILSILVKFIK